MIVVHVDWISTMTIGLVWSFRNLVCQSIRWGQVVKAMGLIVFLYVLSYMFFNAFLSSVYTLSTKSIFKLLSCSLRNITCPCPLFNLDNSLKISLSIGMGLLNEIFIISIWFYDFWFRLNISIIVHGKRYYDWILTFNDGVLIVWVIRCYNNWYWERMAQH